MTKDVPRVSGGEEEHGHLEEFRTDPIGLMQRIREECGDVGWFQLVDKQVIMLSGAEANEFFFRSTDEELNQAEAYPFMTPIFGKGVVFDADPERRKEMLHNTALRGEQMKGHAATIENEVKKIIADWGDEGEIELLDFFSELTIYTSTACLIGLKFREQLDSRFAEYYHELERGTDPLCYVDPYLPIESFRVRDESRVKLVALVQEIMDGRIANPPKGKERSRPARRAGVDQGRRRQPALLRQRGHRHVHLADVRRAPHQFGDVGVDADRAAAPPRCLRRGAGRARRALRRRPGGEFPCAAPDSEARQRAQGDAAPASAADHPDAGRQGRVRGGGLPDPQGSVRGRIAGDLEPDRRGLPRPGRLQPRPLQQARQADSSTGGRGSRSARASTAASGRRSPRCRSRRSSRFCCASTSSRWHSPPTATGTTTPRWSCSWPSRPRCATASAPRKEPAMGLLPRSNSTRTCARATPCANWRPPTCSRCPSAASSRSSTPNRPTTSARTSSGRSICVPPKQYPSKRRGLTMTSWRHAHARTSTTGSTAGCRPTRTAEEAGDWKKLAEFYTDDATYGWNIGPKEDVMCVGSDEIRDVALGLEMEGLENWVYEYQKVLIDEKQGEIVGFWKQIVNKTDGTRDEIYGIGGSWFRLNDER